MPNVNHATDILRVKQIAIDEDGKVTRRFPRIDVEGQLKNTLLFAIHPEICVLSMQVPGGLLDAYEQARIFLFRMTDHGDIILDGVRVDSVQPFAMQEGSGEIRNGMVTFSNVPQHPTVRTRKARVLRSREDRQEFLTSCEKTLGPSFSVFVDGDPRSIRQLDTDTKKQAFLERAPVRPWESRPFQGTAVQQ